MKLIKDEFTSLNVSRQRKYQLRKRKTGLCSTCSEPVVMTGLCLKHAIYHREICRKRYNRTGKRLLNAKSYRLATQAEERKQS